MGRIAWLLTGLILGAVGMFVSMSYHIVRADDGTHLVPKATAKLSMPYVDIRDFQLSDWNERRDLALAIVQAKKGHLLEDAAYGGLQQTMENVISNLQSASDSTLR